MKKKIASDVKLVFHSSTIAMMHGPIYIRLLGAFAEVQKVTVDFVMPVPPSLRPKGTFWLLLEGFA